MPSEKVSTETSPGITLLQSTSKYLLLYSGAGWGWALSICGVVQHACERHWWRVMSMGYAYYGGSLHVTPAGDGTFETGQLRRGWVHVILWMPGDSKREDGCNTVGYFLSRKCILFSEHRLPGWVHLQDEAPGELRNEWNELLLPRARLCGRSRAGCALLLSGATSFFQT